MGGEAVSSRVDWEAAVTRLAGEYPLVAQAGFTDLLRDPDLMGAILRDCLRLRSDSRRGAQATSLPGIQAGIEQLGAMFGTTYDVRSFPEALAAVVGTHSNTQIANKTRMSKSQVQRLRSGAIAPTMDEIQQIADAYRVRAVWFHDYRRLFLVGMVARALEDHPERTAIWIDQLELSP